MKQISREVLLVRPQFLKFAHDEHHTGCRALGPKAALFLAEDPSFLAEIAESVGHDFEEDLAPACAARERPL